MRDRLERAIGM
jgi:integrase